MTIFAGWASSFNDFNAYPEVCSTKLRHGNLSEQNRLTMRFEVPYFQTNPHQGFHGAF
jgi:hypothetical protein